MFIATDAVLHLYKEVEGKTCKRYNCKEVYTLAKNWWRSGNTKEEDNQAAAVGQKVKDDDINRIWSETQACNQMIS